MERPFLLVLTTYTQLAETTNNSELYFEQDWGIIVLDESHKIRNARTATFGQVTKLRGDGRICLSGTIPTAPPL
jgi:SNF2 family DNA or RNA helicase